MLEKTFNIYALAYKNKVRALNILKRDEEANTTFEKAKLLDKSIKVY